MAMKRKTRKLIHKRLDGELKRGQAGEFRREVLGDERVREEYEELRYVAESTARLERLKPPGGFVRRILGRLTGRGKPSG